MTAVYLYEELKMAECGQLGAKLKHWNTPTHCTVAEGRDQHPAVIDTDVYKLKETGTSLRYLYCHVNFSQRKCFFLFWKKKTTLSVRLVYKNTALWIQYTNTALTLASSLTSTLYSGYT